MRLHGTREHKHEIFSTSFEKQEQKFCMSQIIRNLAAQNIKATEP
jgi:hypothetical protein